MNKLSKLWKESGQVIGFVILIVTLNVYWMVLQDQMRNNAWITGLWLVLFFGGATFMGLQGRKHGWRLPKSIKETH